MLWFRKLRVGRTLLSIAFDTDSTFFGSWGKTYSKIQWGSGQKCSSHRISVHAILALARLACGF